MDKATKTNIADHAREISFAVFRVSALIEQTALRATLESAAVSLAAKSVSSSNESLAVAGELEQLVRLAEVIGEIKPLNSKVLLRELTGLKSAISQSIVTSEEVNLEAMFNKEVADIAVLKSVEIATRQPENIPQVKTDIKEVIKFVKPQALEVNQAVNRQSAILQFIKGLPNGCRMKDLIEKFPSVSERTLRNDLQTLISSSSIERFGAVQGPFSYYRVKGMIYTDVPRDGFGSFNDRPKPSSGGVTNGGVIAL
jgi:hypothetical protein